MANYPIGGSAWDPSGGIEQFFLNMARAQQWRNEREALKLRERELEMQNRGYGIQEGQLRLNEQMLPTDIASKTAQASNWQAQASRELAELTVANKLGELMRRHALLTSGKQVPTGFIPEREWSDKERLSADITGEQAKAFSMAKQLPQLPTYNRDKTLNEAITNPALPPLSRGEAMTIMGQAPWEVTSGGIVNRATGEVKHTPPSPHNPATVVSALIRYIQSKMANAEPLTAEEETFIKSMFGGEFDGMSFGIGRKQRQLGDKRTVGGIEYVWTEDKKTGETGWAPVRK